MIKPFCDTCGKEIESNPGGESLVHVEVSTERGMRADIKEDVCSIMLGTIVTGHDLCINCLVIEARKMLTVLESVQVDA